MSLINDIVRSPNGLLAVSAGHFDDAQAVNIFGRQHCLHLRGRHISEERLMPLKNNQSKKKMPQGGVMKRKTEKKKKTYGK